MKSVERFFFNLTGIIFLFFSTTPTLRAQYPGSTQHGWHLLDFRTDSIYGAGINITYRDLLKNKKSYPVIVAVIDTGVDTAQEDLMGQFWTNPAEIPGNGIDDDHNGYIDDVHGVI